MKPSCAFFKNVRAAKAFGLPCRTVTAWVAMTALATTFASAARAAVDIVRVNEPSPSAKGPAPLRVGDTVYFQIQSKEQGFTRFAAKKPDAEHDFDAFQAGYKANEQPTAEGYMAVTLVKPGTLSIGPIELFQDDRKIDETSVVTLKVESAIDASDQKPKEAEPPLPPVSVPLPLELIALIAAALVLLASIVYFVVKKLRAPKSDLVLPEIPAEPPKPEHETALMQLAALEREQLDRKGEYKRLYFGVSEIIKTYLGARYGFDAEESTSRELSEKLEAFQLSSATVGSVRELFRMLDVVKFTDQTPSASEPAEIFAKARALVSETKRVPPPPQISPAETPPASGAQS